MDFFTVDRTIAGRIVRFGQHGVHRGLLPDADLLEFGISPDPGAADVGSPDLDAKSGLRAAGRS